MSESETRFGFNLANNIVKMDDLNLVMVVFDEARDGETVRLVAPDGPVDGVDVPWGFVGVDFGAGVRVVGGI